MCTREMINSKDVYIFRDHHHALLPWSKIRGDFETAPILITLDHHTDTRPAYLNHMFHTYGEDSVNNVEIRESLASKVVYSSEGSVNEAIQNLRHDEHIHAAILSDIIKFAFVIQLNDSIGTVSVEQKKYREVRFGNGPPWKNNVEYPQPPFTYEVPSNGIFVIPTLCLPWCDRKTHNDECQKELYDSVLEDYFLQEKIREGNEMAIFAGIESIEEQNYILDIDLDYFHTEKSVMPKSATIFSRLICNASAITIALEPSCVTSLALEGESISSEYLLEKVKEHIACA